jgi:hypothetical protein
MPKFELTLSNGEKAYQDADSGIQAMQKYEATHLLVVVDAFKELIPPGRCVRCGSPVVYTEWGAIKCTVCGVYA